MTGTPQAAVRATGHPLQRCGALAIAELAGRSDPAAVTGADLRRVAEQITEDAVTAATAAKGSAAYDWWKVLFALYPNAKPTHARRPKDAAVLRRDVGQMFAPESGNGPVWPCTFCATPCGVVWTKATLPMFDTDRAVNTLPPGVAGWPVCRACRVAMWALPYGARVGPGSAAVLSSDNPAVERAFVVRNVRRARRIRQMGFNESMLGRGPEAVAVQVLRPSIAQSPAAATLWMFKNDNQEAWLRVSGTRTGTAVFVERMLSDADCRAGWRALRRALHRRNAAGTVVVDGATAAARTLFDRDLQPVDRLLRTLQHHARDVDTLDARTLWQWRALARLYREAMYGMDTHDLKPVATLLAQWIKAESSRGRFNEYRQAADRGYLLNKVLMNATSRMALNGNRSTPLPPATVAELVGSGGRRWQLRSQLWFEVLVELDRLGVSLTATDAEQENGDEAPMEHEDADPFGDENEEYA